jgi:hypothetical protein
MPSRLCQVSVMLDVTYKPLMLSVVMLNVIILNIIVPFENPDHVIKKLVSQLIGDGGPTYSTGKVQLGEL